MKNIQYTTRKHVTASQSQAILMMQKCIEKDTQGIWSKRILGRDSPISMVSLSQRAPSMYRPWEKQGQHHIKLSQCHIYIYIIQQDYTPTPDCVYIFANTCIYFLFIVKSISVKKRFIIELIHFRTQKSTHIYISTILRFVFHEFLFLQHFKFKPDCINGNCVLSGIVLRHTCQIKNTQTNST